MKQRAFTLAEVLITMGILGVIAALTLPSMMRVNQETSIAPRLAKIQTAFEEATTRVMLDDPSKSLGDIEEHFEERLAEHLVMTTVSGGYKLKDDVEVAFEDANGFVPVAAGTGFKNVLIDLNGRDVKPNVEGVDQFTFVLSTSGLMIAQGCAALIQSNNWKVPKDYDVVTCPSYSIGGNPE